MFTDPLKLTIHRRFLDGANDLGLCEDEVLKKVNRCSGDLRTVMEFYYGSMPVKDSGEYEFSFLQKIAEFRLAVEQESEWTEQIPEDIRLNFVLNYRVDLEQIENSGEFFYQALKDRIHGKNLFQAALTVNAWCSEHVEEQPSVGAAFSPTSVLKAGGGDSRQLSILEVSALRSVGIPARAVFAPARSHQDGRQFWVEFWFEDAWHFIEACQPNPMVNQNWFEGIAAFSMLIMTRTFLPMEGEEMLVQRKRGYSINLLSHYASARRFTVTVIDGTPAAGTPVQFELLNGSALVAAVTLTTDEAGRAELTLGCGSIHLHAFRDGQLVQALVDTTETDYAILDFANAVTAEPSSIKEFVMKPPKATAEFFTPLTDIQKAKIKSEQEWAAQARKDYASCFYQANSANALAARFNQPEHILNLLKRSKGNFEEIYRFLMTYFNTDTRVLKLEYLESLSEKDLCGVSAEVLTDHFQAALPFQVRYDREIFVKYLLNPKIGDEPLTAYRSGIASTLGAHGAIIQKDPRLLWQYTKQFQVQTGIGLINATPLGMLKTGLVDEVGRITLFVAMCRTFGFPARLNPSDFSVEYYSNGSFHCVREKPTKKINWAKLELTDSGEVYRYRKNWSLARLESGFYYTLKLNQTVWKNGTLTLKLRPGSYRLITSVRVTDGNVFCRAETFQLKSDECKCLEIKRHKFTLPELISNAPLTSFRLYNLHYQSTPLDKLVKDKAALLIWIQDGIQETERLLLDLIQSHTALTALNCNLLLIIRDHPVMNYPPLVLVRREFPLAQIYCSDFDDTALLLANRLGLNRNAFPLTVVMRPGVSVAYAYTGYDEALVDRLIEVIGAVSDEIKPV